jgi:hypothetical protein
MKKENKKITELVKTFEDARKLTGRPDVPDFSNLPTDMRKHFEAQYKMIVIAEALNEGWIPDWDNYNEYKYYPWFEMSPSSFAFDGSISLLRVRMRVAGLALNFGRTSLQNMQQSNSLIFGKISR